MAPFSAHTPPSREPGCGAGVRPFCSSAKTPSFEAHALRRWPVLRPVLCSYRFLDHCPSFLRISQDCSLPVSPCCVCPHSWKNRFHHGLPTPQPLSLSTTSSLRSLSSLSQLPAPMTFPAPHCLATTPDFHLTSSAPHVQQPFESSETWIGLSTFRLPSCPPKGWRLHFSLHSASSPLLSPLYCLMQTCYSLFFLPPVSCSGKP